MRAVVQRVATARVVVEEREVAAIGAGLLVYLGIGQGDTAAELDYLAGKIAGLRIFADEAGAMNRAVLEAGGQALVVSQFTLYGDARRGKRPSFSDAMDPGAARELYLGFVERLRALGVATATGVFQAHMRVESVNDGPVTILIDSRKAF